MCIFLATSFYPVFKLKKSLYYALMHEGIELSLFESPPLDSKVEIS
jgi:hypothetical protein